MCKVCEPILGMKTKPHKEEECPLKQASYCPLCACRGHFVHQCSKKPTRRISDEDISIPTSTTQPTQGTTYQIAENGDAYAEYMKLYGHEPTLRKDRNRAFVQEHLKERGYEMVHPPSKPTTPSA